MPKTSTKNNKPLKKVVAYLQIRRNLFTVRLRVLRGYIRSRVNRQTFANIFMFSFIILTSIGAGMIYPPAGWVVAGMSCGIFGFLLGLE